MLDRAKYVFRGDVPNTTTDYPGDYNNRNSYNYGPFGLNNTENGAAGKALGVTKTI